MKNIFKKLNLLPDTKINNLWELIDFYLKQRWIRFGIVGAAATFAYFILGILFVTILKFPVLIGNTLAYVLSFYVSYWGQSHWTFRAQGNPRAMLLKFAITQAFGLVINSLIVEAGIYAGLHYIIAMLIAIVLVPIVVYIICKCWVFRDNKAAGEKQ